MELNKLYLGDCLEVMKGIEDKSIDFCYADPPYGINKAEFDSCYPKYNFEKELLRISKKGIAITTGQDNIATCILRLGKDYKGIHVARNLNGMTYNKLGYENCLLTVIGGKAKRGMNFFEFVIKGTKPEHPSPKPLEFMMKLIERFTNENDTILDPFIGSGTTAVACINTNRNFIGMEKDEKYYQLANERINNHKAQLKLL